MPKLIECELRGPITWSDFNRIKDDLEKHYGKFQYWVELAIFYKGGYDLRVKINNSQSKLSLKKRIEGQIAKKEFELYLSQDQILPTITLLHNLGFSNWLFSKVTERYEAQRGESSCSVKFGTQIGDFIEFEELLDNEDEIEDAVEKINTLSNKLEMPLWDENTYKSIVESSWYDQKTEPLIQSDSLHPLIIDILSKISEVGISNTLTIKQALRAKSNNYSIIEDKFLKLFGSEFLSENPINIKFDLHSTISIVIPAYNAESSLPLVLDSIQSQDLSSEEFSKLEVIVVDDGSKDNTHILLNEYKSNFKFRYIKQSNLGRSNARNIGAKIATGEILIFIDADVVLDKNFIREHACRHHIHDNLVLVSLKENIERGLLRDLMNDNTQILDKPNIRKDFRFGKEVKEEWLRIHRHTESVEIGYFNIIEDSQCFKTLGESNCIGVWDLPSMVITNAVSMKRIEFNRTGGFSMQFKGWGMEDTFLGACLIALGNFVAPVLSTGIYHIEHEPINNTESSKLLQFNRNVLTYYDLINKPLETVLKENYVFTR